MILLIFFLQMSTFQQLGLGDWLINALKGISITEPTEIQQNSIPAILNGSDCICSAKTGSGKTASFALPILQKLSAEPFGVFALVLTPTRELAFQIAEQFRILGQSIGLKQCVVVGGMNMTTQALEMAQKPHIIVATPGRLVDHIQCSANAIHFKRLKFLVLDEADRLITDNFSEDLGIILQGLPKTRQTLLFSATMTPEVEALEFAGNKKPFKYSCASRFDTVDLLNQKYIFIPSQVREVYLSFLLLNDFADKTVIIFANKPRTCEIIRLMFKEQGIRSTALHSQMSQNDRIGSIAKFKGGIVPILICTDVGSRGLDIPTVSVVINYQIPADPTDYIHRIGRTARAGRGGLALSIICERDIELIQNIESKTGIFQQLTIEKKMEEYPVSENKVLELMGKVGMAKKQAAMELVDKDFGSLRKIQQAKKHNIILVSRTNLARLQDQEAKSLISITF